MFLHKHRTLSAVIFQFFSISFVAFVCILYQVIFACCAEMFVWFVAISKRARAMNVMFGFVTYHNLYIFPSEVSVLSDILPFRNLTFYNVLARQQTGFFVL